MQAAGTYLLELALFLAFATLVPVASISGPIMVQYTSLVYMHDGSPRAGLLSLHQPAREDTHSNAIGVNVSETQVRHDCPQRPRLTEGSIGTCPRVPSTPGHGTSRIYMHHEKGRTDMVPAAL